MTYLHGDHPSASLRAGLGSASLQTNDTTGAKVAEMRYKPFGDISYQWGTLATDKRFTGQRQEAGQRLA